MLLYLLQSSDGGITSTVLLVIIGFVVFFLICREILCWYYKINQRITIQTETNNLLKELINLNKKGNNLTGAKEINNLVVLNEDSTTEFLQNIINNYEQYTKSDVLTSISFLRSRGVAILPVNLEKISSYFGFSNITKMWIEINENYSK
jgi:hypothetical protein